MEKLTKVLFGKLRYQWQSTKLNNLITMIDYNKMQSYDFNKTVLNLEPLAKKWKSFGFNVLESNGHDIKDIKKNFTCKKIK